MNLHEYQTKQFFACYGLPAPVGYACTALHEAEETASKIGAGPRVAKCQVHTDGRGKAGGVKVVNSKEGIRAFAEGWLSKHLVTYQTDASGQSINQILVEAAADITKELYPGAVIDHSSRRVIFMTSTEGDVEIEEMAGGTPYLIHRAALDSLIGLTPHQGCELTFKLGLGGKLVQQFTKTFMSLVTIFLKRDLALIEIGPLVITRQGDLICLDGKLGAGGNVLFHQPDLREIRDQSQEGPRETRATQWELNYVALDGNIGYMVSGTDLTMGMMDIVKLHGGEPTNFLDVGGGAIKERVTETFKIILSNDKVGVALVNIFGGIVRCDLIADGIIGTVAEMGVNVSVVVCLEGNSAGLGVKRLTDSDLNTIAVRGLMGAAQQVVAVVEGK